jgi:hypothetical protein
MIDHREARPAKVQPQILTIDTTITLVFRRSMGGNWGGMESARSTIVRILTDELAAAQARHTAATKRFDCLVKEVPSGLAHPDGANRIHAAGSEANATLEAYVYALKRYTDFILYRIVPDDLDLTKTQPD